MPRTPKENPKRVIGGALGLAARNNLKARVGYSGSPYHKRNPGDFGLTPPAQPRPDKSLCDEASLFRRAEATSLLHRGIDASLCSPMDDDAFPKHIWAVRADGMVFEAILDNPTAGTYHGYPLIDDPFREVVLQTWRERRSGHV